MEDVSTSLDDQDWTERWRELTGECRQEAKWYTHEGGYLFSTITNRRLICAHSGSLAEDRSGYC